MLSWNRKSRVRQAKDEGIVPSITARSFLFVGDTWEVDFD